MEAGHAWPWFAANTASVGFVKTTSFIHFSALMAKS